MDGLATRWILQLVEPYGSMSTFKQVCSEVSQGSALDLVLLNIINMI